MTENQANEILEKVGAHLFETVENVNAISVVKLDKDEYDLKIIASPVDQAYSFTDKNEKEFQKEFKALSERISRSLLIIDFKLSKENFIEGRLPEGLFQKKELYEFKPIVKFLSPSPVPCEFCHKRGEFSIGPIFKIVATPDRCFAMLANHTTSGMNIDDSFFVGRRGSTESYEAFLFEQLSPYNEFDLAIGELDFKTFMKKKLSIKQAHYGDSIKHYGCTTAGGSGSVISVNATVRASLTGERRNYITTRLIELNTLSLPGNSGAPVVKGRSNQTLIGLIHSSTEQDTTFCTNLFKAKEENLLEGYETSKIFMATT